VIDLLTDGRDLISSGVDVIVEALGGVEPARTLVAHALALGIPVVTANKSLVAAHGPELRALAAHNRVPFLCDAAALAGVPCLGALASRPLASSVRTIAGVLNGTTHYIVNAIASGATFERALADAQSRGYAEPDSHADISGRDAAEKLTLLLQLAGCANVRTNEVTTRGIDGISASDIACARQLGGTIKPVALASIGRGNDNESGAWVGPALVDEGHLFARLDGVTNAIALTGDHGRASCFIGPGAGPEVTAATIIDDVVEAARSIADTMEPRDRMEPRAFRPGVAAGSKDPALHCDRFTSPSPSGWFVRLGNGGAFAARDVAEFLAAYHVPALQVTLVDGVVAARTVPSSWVTVQAVVDALNACGADACAWPVLDAGSRA
jgi:homoserine dehydrogenase